MRIARPHQINRASRHVKITAVDAMHGAPVPRDKQRPEIRVLVSLSDQAMKEFTARHQRQSCASGMKARLFPEHLKNDRREQAVFTILIVNFDLFGFEGLFQTLLKMFFHNRSYIVSKKECKKLI